MRLFDNEATASLTDRERTLLEMLGRCRHFLADLNGSSFVNGKDHASTDIRQRSGGLARAIGGVIDADRTLFKSIYGG